MLAKSHADEFKKQNPRFSHHKFYAASGINPADMNEANKANKASEQYKREVSFFVEEEFFSEGRADRNGYKDERDECFDKASSKLGQSIAIKAFREEAKNAKVNVKKILSADFVEFDSGNLSHANAYWDITYAGDKFPDVEEINEDSVTDSLVANVKDALMFLKIQGDEKVPTNSVFNEFKKRGIDVSLEQLQELFPQGNDFLKNITNSYVEFNNNQPEAPKSFSQVQDNKEKVGDMALSAFKKRK